MHGTRKPGTVAEFLEALRRGGPWSLNTIDPDSGRITTEGITSARAIKHFVARHNGKTNLYYAVNVTADPSRRAKKQDVTAIEYAHVDLDPADDETRADAKRRYLKALDEQNMPATFVIDSG